MEGGGEEEQGKKSGLPFSLISKKLRDAWFLQVVSPLSTWMGYSLPRCGHSGKLQLSKHCPEEEALARLGRGCPKYT